MQIVSNMGTTLYLSFEKNYPYYSVKISLYSKFLKVFIQFNDWGSKRAQTIFVISPKILPN